VPLLPPLRGGGARQRSRLLFQPRDEYRLRREDARCDLVAPPKCTILWDEVACIRALTEH
jgi:hypothetical protein